MIPIHTPGIRQNHHCPICKMTFWVEEESGTLFSPVHCQVMFFVALFRMFRDTSFPSFVTSQASPL